MYFNTLSTTRKLQSFRRIQCTADPRYSQASRLWLTTVESSLYDKFRMWSSAVGTGTAESQHRAVQTEAPNRCARTRNRRRAVSAGRATRGQVPCTSVYDDTAMNSMMAFSCPPAPYFPYISFCKYLVLSIVSVRSAYCRLNLGRSLGRRGDAPNK